MAAMIALTARSGAAQVSPPVEPNVPAGIVAFRSPSCASSARTDRFAQLLAIELASARIQLIKDAPAPSEAIGVETDGALCDASAPEVSVALVRSGTRVFKSIDVADVEPSARLRALALAVAELVRGAQNEAARGEATKSADPEGASAENLEREKVTEAPRTHDRHREPTNGEPADAGAATAAAVSRDRRSYRGDVRAAGLGRFFAPESTPLFGVSAAAALRLRPEWLLLRADATAGWTSANDPLGDVSLALYSGGVSFLATAGTLPEFEIGPHLELGYARAVGAARGAGSIAAGAGHAIALASLAAGVRVWLDRWALLAEFEAGAALAGAEIFADDRRIATISGFFAGARIGLAFGF